MQKAVKIKSIRCIGKADVYNMEVKGHHNFSVNGGFVVHNCMDSLRYLINTNYPVKAKAKIRFV